MTDASEWDMANGMPSKWSQGLSVVQAVWAVILIFVTVATAVANEHIRVTQTEWEVEHLKAGWSKEVEAAQAWRDRVDVLLVDIRERLARMEAKR